MLARLRRFAAAAVAVAGFLAHAPRASADYILDGFDNPNPGQIYQISLLNGNPYTSPTAAVSPGVSRVVQITVNSPAPPNFNSVSGTIGGGQFSMDTANDSAATARITYALTGSASNLTGAAGLELGFLNLDPGTTATGGAATTMPVTVDIVTATGTLTGTALIDGSGVPFSRSIDFGSLSGTGDLSQVNSITFTLNSASPPQKAVDFALDGVTVKTVPAPPAALLAGLGVLALLGRARLGRKPVA